MQQAEIMQPSESPMEEPMKTEDFPEGEGGVDPDDQSQNEPLEGPEGVDNAGEKKTHPDMESGQPQPGAEDKSLPPDDDIPADGHEVQIRLLCDAKLCGGLIGAGGGVINKMRQDSGGQIEIQRQVPRVPKRLVIVRAVLPKLCKALHLIAKRLAEVSLPRDSPPDPEGEPIVLTLTLLVASGNVGCIIGRAGECIQRIRQDSHANIKVASDSLPRSTEKTVTISGYSDQVERAIKGICQQLHDSPDRAVARLLYDPEMELQTMRPAAFEMQPYNRDDRGFRGASTGGYGSYSAPRGNDRYSPYNNGGRYGSSDTGGYSRYGGGGTPPGRSSIPGRTYGSTPSRHDGPGYDSRPPSVGTPYRAPQGGRDRPPTRGRQPPQVPYGSMQQDMEVPYPIPKSLIGGVIGRGGQNIRAIRKQSGATVKIEDPRPNDNDRLVTVSGTGHQVAIAIQLIQAQVENH